MVASHKILFIDNKLTKMYYGLRIYAENSK